MTRPVEAGSSFSSPPPPATEGDLSKGTSDQSPKSAFDSASLASKNNIIYLRGQGKAFGFELPLDPSRVNGKPSTPKEPRREDYSSDEEYEQARSDQADALASQEKHALSGVPFN